MGRAAYMRAAWRLAVGLLFALALAPAGASAQSRPADTPPPGANDFACMPSAEHPDPVVLVHGLGANMSLNWSRVSPVLKTHGYCVFALTYGRDPDAPYPFDQSGGVVRMEDSAQELSAYVDRVLAATGAQEVDIVGHSEGTVMPNYYAKFLGGAAKIDDYVALTPLWDGTDLLALGTIYGLAEPSGVSPALTEGAAQFCASCPQFLKGSPFMKKMNEGGGPAVPGVTYTNILTEYDFLVVPYTSGLMDSPNATNIVLQDQCETDFSEHGGVAFDPIAIRNILNALDPANAQPPRCTVVLPYVGAPGEG